jgi:CheY-like chemotaxis protein
MATVLLVDDEPSVREVLRIYAEGNGLTVVGEAVNGRQAVDLTARLAPDVIVLDHEMPEMTGLEALPRLRRRAPRAVIVFYTSAVTHSKQDALALGATAYVTKSESAKTVIRTVLELIESRHPVAT